MKTSSIVAFVSLLSSLAAPALADTHAQVHVDASSSVHLERIDAAGSNGVELPGAVRRRHRQGRAVPHRS